MINTENYESYLYLYQEGELDSSTRNEVERFLLEHPDIREEMETYYDTSLVVTAEPPVNKKRPTIPLWRWTSAACVILAVGLGIYLSHSHSTIGDNIVAETKTVIPPATTEPSIDIPQPTIEHPEINAPKIRVRRPEQYKVITPTQEPSTVTLSDDIEEPVSNSLPVESSSQNNPIIVATTQLAEVNEIIIVDDLARVIPNSKPESTQPVLNLAIRITRNIENKRQDFANFIYNMFHPERENQEMAEVYYIE